MRMSQHRNPESRPIRTAQNHAAAAAVMTPSRHQIHAPATVRDPVCGMTVDPATSKHRFDHHGETFHFCCAGCKTKFAADPKAYLETRTCEAPHAPEGTIYTCPMHPEIRQVGPGSCPICGMALEPDVVSLDTPPNPELADMTRRFWIGLALSVPPVVLEMGGHLVGGHGLVDPTLSNWIQLVFATPVVVWAGWPFFVRGWQSLANAQSQYVHADRDRHRRGLALQPGRHDSRRRFFRRLFADMAARSRSISNPPPSSPCWCCSARCWSCAPARRHRAPSRRCSNWRRRPRDASQTTAPSMKSRSTALRSATNCASAPAKRCRSTASFSKAARRSMNRW